MNTRGIRNNNPCNLKYGCNWEGMVENPLEFDKTFCVFKSPEWGIRACVKCLLTYKKLGIETVRCILLRFAPPDENNVTDYIEDVCARLGVHRDKTLDLHDSETMLKLIKAIIIHENGFCPYSDIVIKKGINLAGVI